MSADTSSRSLAKNLLWIRLPTVTVSPISQYTSGEASLVEQLNYRHFQGVTGRIAPSRGFAVFSVRQWYVGLTSTTLATGIEDHFCPVSPFNDSLSVATGPISAHDQNNKVEY